MSGLVTMGWRGARRRDPSPVQGRHRAPPEGTISGDVPEDPDAGLPPEMVSPYRAPSAGLPGADDDLTGRQVLWLSRIASREREGKYRLTSRLQARELARWLREDSPGLDDLKLAVTLLTLLDFTAEIGGDLGAEITLRTLIEAIELAVLDLTAAARAPTGEG